MIARIVFPALFAGALLAAPVLADDGPRCPKRAGVELTPTQVTDVLVAHGYERIRKIERDDGCYEVKASDSQGRRFELKVDPVNGSVLKRKAED